MVEAEAGCSYPQFSLAEPGSFIKGPCSAHLPKDTTLSGCPAVGLTPHPGAWHSSRDR